MGLDIRLPEISGGSTEAQLRQLQSYLYSLASQLQYAFDTVAAEQAAAPAIPVSREKTPAETFTSIKSLIIKSADIVDSYTERISRSLAGSYAAQSEFGQFRQETEQRVEENAEQIDRGFRNLQELLSSVEGIESSLMEVNAYIRTGLLYSDDLGTPVYGVEIGQQEHRDGAVQFRKFARLTADRLCFYDSNDTEVAYISDYRLHVTAADIRMLTAEEATVTRLQIGDYTWRRTSDGHLTLS